MVSKYARIAPLFPPKLITHHREEPSLITQSPLTASHHPPLTTSLRRSPAHHSPAHTLILTQHTHKRGKKIRKVENGKKKRRREERERKERTTPARAPPRGPSSLCALTVAPASPSRALTVAAQHHHRVCSLSLLSIVVVTQHRHRRSPEKEGKVSGKDTKTNETKAAVLAMDESVLDVDQVENLIKFCPTKEEMELLKGYTGDKENLGKCEQVTEFKKSLKTVNSACEEVLAERSPGLLDFHLDLVSLEAATKDNIEDDDNED
ncbi:Formin-like protein [Arachis hypogaea]|nr:Formin-like protein [Arachis hypogaea]